MWPLPSEVLAHTVAAERAIEGLYAEALRRWAPTAKAAALPSLGVTAAANNPANTISTSELPPDAAAVEQQRAAADWAVITETVIIAGITVLYSAAVVEAMQGLGIALPDVDTAVDVAALVAIEQAVMRIVNQAVPDMGADELRHAAGIVDATPALREARDVVLSEQRERAATTPAFVAEKITAAVATADVDAGATASEKTTAQRAAATEALDPAGEQLRKIAETAGHQAASVQNEATLAAAHQSEDADELESVWLATLDGKTRPTHWAAWGQRVPIGTAFTVGAASLMFPGDPTGPPEEVKNCRCRLGILAKDEPLPGEADAHTERLGGRDSVAINREGRTQTEEIERRAEQGNTRARDNRDGVGTVASGGWTAPSEQEIEMTRAIGSPTTAELKAFSADEAGTEGEQPAEMYRTFTDQALAPIGTPTSDRRMLAADIDLKFRSFPLPLRWCESDEGSHGGAVTVGVIESARVKDGMVLASGYLLNTDDAEMAAYQNAHGVSQPSVDFGDATVIYTDSKGNELTEDEFWEAYLNDGDWCQTITAGEILGTTLVSIPAFDTRIHLDAERSSRDVALVASAAESFEPKVYDPALFENPNFAVPARMTYDAKTGRIFGHLAEWGQPHRSVQGEVRTAPRSPSGYSNFHTSPSVHLSDGSRLPVGRLTVGIGHADTRLNGAPAAAHYDNVESCFALVRIGEDRHGIWCSGVAAPWASAEKIEMGLSASLSGDWRDYGQGLDLVAVLAVNTPGFAIRVRTDDTGREVAMVASMGPRRAEAQLTAHRAAPMAELKKVVVEAITEERRTRELAASRESALSRATSLVGEPPAPEPEKTPNDRMLELLGRD